MKVMNLVCVNRFRLHSFFVSRSCPIAQIKLSNCKRYFADDAAVDAKKKNLYETLGLRSSATHNEIKKAYYDLTLKYHPDRSEDCSEAAIKFREVAEAYEILGNYALRKKYDRGIPIALVKKTVRPTVGHKAQFQEFYDSRFGDSKGDSDDARSREINDLGAYTERDRQAREKAMEEYRNPGPVQYMVTAFFIVLIYFSSRYD